MHLNDPAKQWRELAATREKWKARRAKTAATALTAVARMRLLANAHHSPPGGSAARVVDAAAAPQAKALPAAAAPAADHRARLVRFYETHNRAKLGTVDATLAKYAGREATLFESLERKYVAHKTASTLPPPCGAGPRCFMDIEIGGVPAGRLEFEVFADKVPLTAANFQALCVGDRTSLNTSKRLRFEGSAFHRVVPGFVVQGGDFTKGNGTGGESIYAKTAHGDLWGKFKDEPVRMAHSRGGLLSYYSELTLVALSLRCGWRTPAAASCPWPTAAPTPTGRSSSSPSRRRPTSTASTSSSAPSRPARTSSTRWRP